MIINIFLIVSHKIIMAIKSIFPSGSPFPTEVHNAFSTLGGYVGLIDSFVSVKTILFCLILIFSTELIMFIFNITKWIFSVIPKGIKK